MVQITRNEAFRLLERRRRRTERELPEPVAGEPAGEDERIEGVIGALATEQALSTLRSEDRTLIRLRYVDDMSQPDMARRLNMPEGTVKVRLHRVRHRLRTVLEEVA